MAVVRVFAEADVGDHDKLGELVLDGSHRPLHHALGIVGGGGGRVFVRRDAEQEHGGDAEIDHLADLSEQVADGQLRSSRAWTGWDS